MREAPAHAGASFFIISLCNSSTLSEELSYFRRRALLDRGLDGRKPKLREFLASGGEVSGAQEGGDGSVSRNTLIPTHTP